MLVPSKMFGSRGGGRREGAEPEHVATGHRLDVEEKAVGEVERASLEHHATVTERTNGHLGSSFCLLFVEVFDLGLE
jgi:hypothetical protein